VLLGFVALAMLLDRSYRESAALGAWTGTPLDVMREQSRATPWYRRPPWPAWMQGSLALVWKGFLRLLRESPVHLLVLPVVSGGVFFIASRPGMHDPHLALISGTAAVLLLLTISAAALHSVHDLLIFRRLGFSPFALGFGTLSPAIVRAWIAIVPIPFLATEFVPNANQSSILLAVLVCAAAAPHVLVCGRFLPVASLWLRYRIWYLSWLSPILSQFVLVLVLACAITPLLPAVVLPAVLTGSLGSLRIGFVVSAAAYAAFALPMLWVHGLMLMTFDMETLIRIQGEEEKK
jgi:hypothetical protein